MAAEAEETLMEMLSGERGGGGFIPFLVGLVGRRSPEAAEGEERIVLVNPMTQGMVVLQGDAGMVAEILSGAGGRMGPPPASKASIEGMRTVEVGEEEEEEECPVCLDGMRGEGEEEVVKEMPCRHRFHEGCIGKWLGMHGSCPVCRFRMPEEEGEAEARKGGDGEEEEERMRGPRREVWVTIAIGRRRSRSGDDGGEAGSED